MLPDLCAMARRPCLHQNGADVDEGHAFHLATDAVFHQTEMFIHHNHRVLSELRTIGISRGPARACAHMGVEMLIDAQLTTNASYLDAYLDALRWGAAQLSQPDQSELAQHWSPSDRTSFAELLLVLVDRGRAVFEASQQRIHDRLLGALRHRPRLSPSPPELLKIAHTLASDQLVVANVEALLSEMQILQTPSLVGQLR